MKTKPSSQVLMEIRISDSSKKIRLSGYADLIVFDEENNLTAIRFGGYPEQVQALSDALLGGCQLEVIGETTVSSKKRSNFIRSIIPNDMYAECFMQLNDDEIQSIIVSGENEKEEVRPDRRLFFYGYEPDDLYHELDRKLAVPLLEEFSNYFIGELLRRKILKPLNVLSLNFPFSGWQMTISQDEKEVIEILEQGLQSGEISIPGSDGMQKDLFENIENFTGYLQAFGQEISRKIKDTFKPVFDPENETVCDKILEVNQHIEEHAGYSLFSAQLGAAEAIKRSLDNSRVGILVAECGSGKTKIGTAALYAHQHSGSHDENHFNVILCPTHLCEKWVREIQETLPNCYAYIAQTLSDIDRLQEIYQQGKQDVYCILSKEKARNGYMRYPAVRYSKHKKGYFCPDCGMVQEETVLDDGMVYKQNARQFFFQNENQKNHECQFCGSPLWSAYNPDVSRKYQWVRIGGYGYVDRYRAYQHTEQTKDQSLLEKIWEIHRNPEGLYNARGAHRRYPVSKYIKEQLQEVDGLICDEMHQYSGESAQGESMAELAGIAKKIVPMTATLVNGYAKGLFYLLYRLKPYLMQLDKKDYATPQNFCHEYGVVEAVYEVAKADYNASSKSKKRKIREKFLPGVSPIVYSRFLLDNAVFLSLADMGKELPDYEEIPIGCDMSTQVANQYQCLESDLKHYLKFHKIGKRLMSAYLNLLSAYPDQPYGQPPIMHPDNPEQILITPIDVADFDTIQPKDEVVLELVEKKVKAKERVIIYVAWTRLDTQDKLNKLLTKNGYRVSILDTNVPPIKREKWVDDKVRDGIDVLIVNPALVETGLDLNAFTTLVFFNVAYNLYIFRQASRRSWRINQTAPKVEVYMLYYNLTMQQRALSLMASKLAAATVIEGNISDEGLAAMSDCQDLTTQLATQLAKGIKDDADNLAESFRKMAILHDDNDHPPVQDVPMNEVAEEPEIVLHEPSMGKSGQAIHGIPVMAKLPKKKKKNIKSEEDMLMSLFDLIA